MQLSRCPICHARIGLDTLCQDEAGRELLGLLAGLDAIEGSALVTYLGLFRPETRDLANDRALRLAREALAVHTDKAIVTTAMAETVRSMRTKQDGGGFKPLTNHRYLLSVLDTVSARGTALMPIQNGVNALVNPTAKPVSKTAQAIEFLKEYPTPADMPDWFTRTVCGSLAELLMLGLDNMPAYDTLPIIAERWLNELWPKRQWRKDCRFRGAKRLRDAFILAAESKHRWPSVGDVLGNVPSA